MQALVILLLVGIALCFLPFLFHILIGVIAIYAAIYGPLWIIGLIMKWARDFDERQTKNACSFERIRNKEERHFKKHGHYSWEIVPGDPRYVLTSRTQTKPSALQFSPDRVDWKEHWKI